MASKIFIAILVNVSVISCRTDLTIDICQTDQVVLDFVNRLEKGIVPIFLIANINENPFDETTMTPVKIMFEGFYVSNLLIVTADTCVATDMSLKLYGDNVYGYPSIFMLKDGQLMGGNRTYFNYNEILETYNSAFSRQNEISGDKFASLLEKTIEIQSKMPHTEVGQGSQSSRVFSSETLPYETALRSANPWTIQPSVQITENSSPRVGYPTSTTVYPIRPPGPDYLQQIKPMTSRTPDLTLSLSTPEQPESEVRPRQGVTQSTFRTGVRTPVGTYPINRDAPETRDFFSDTERQAKDKDHERGSHMTPLQSSGLELFGFEKRKKSGSPSGSQ